LKEGFKKAPARQKIALEAKLTWSAGTKRRKIAIVGRQLRVFISGVAPTMFSLNVGG